MDRRTSIQTLFRGSKKASGRTASSAMVLNGGLSPYQGPWTRSEAAHLLRRASFGPTQDEIREAHQLGLDGAVAKLFEPTVLPDPPINYINTTDPFVPVGDTWIDAAYVVGINLRGYRVQSLYAWTVNNMLTGGFNIREKMTLFWHNHYATEMGVVNDPKFQYRYINLLRSNATGNFRELTKLITIDPTMLRYLNGNQNTRNNPNENYARELLELFTIGKGPQVGPGDYTNYTEDDILEIAKVLTGWRDRGYNTNDPTVEVTVEFRNNVHTLGEKTLSHRFDNHVIPELGDQEYAYLIDRIFEKPACALFLARKLYRWFVYYDITPEIEVDVINPLADLILANDYDISEALKALLSSEHFFDACIRGAMIKHPIDYMMSMLRKSGWSAPGDLVIQYRYWRLIHPYYDAMQMGYFNPPGVSGWKAWYQDPAWYQSWLTSVTLPLRANAAIQFAYTGIQVGNNGRAMFPVLEWVATLDDPTLPDAVIDGLALQLFAHPVSETKKAYLKEVLLPGLPDYEWTLEYTDHLADPNNTELANAVANKLRNLIATMMQMPEYQLS
jgi:uncharacterized protein (DUF1800 family)